MGHTKAPWIVAENTKTFVYALDFDGERNRFDLNVYGQRGVPVEELHANARLIAAAPELLAALKNIDNAHCGKPLMCGHDYDCTCVMEMARNAIKKAEGV